MYTLAETFATVLPDSSEAVPIRAADSPTPDISEVLKILEAHDKSRAHLEQVYVEGRLPISTLAKLSAKTVLETMTYLAANRDLPVHVCRGRTADLEEAMRILDHTASAVLEPSALATLALLEEVSVLESLPFQCLVTEGTLQELRDLARDDPPHGKVGQMGSKDGRFWIQETAEEEEDARRQRLREVVASIERSCEVIGGSNLAGVEAVLRNKLRECIAQGSAEAAAAASFRKATLWTDDHLLHALVKSDLAAPRVWTQAVFIWANARGKLNSQHRSRVTARMLQLRYAFTSSNAAVVLDTCEATSWRTEDPELAAVLADFGNRGWDHESAVGVTAETIRRIWREAPVEEHARAVTGRLLVHLADRPDAKGIVKRVLDNVDSLLGLALTRADSLREVLRTFLRGGGPLL